MPKPRILFVSRNYPPQVGGIEAYSYNLIRQFERHDRIDTILLKRSRKHLIWFMPYAFFKALYLVRKESIPFVHLCDGFLSIFGILLKGLTRAKVSVAIHGLDITYRHPLYQKIVPRCVALMDKVICGSRYTFGETVLRGIPQRKCMIIHYGINANGLNTPASREDCRAELENRTRIPLQGKTVLFSIGRLIKRKGIAWFVEEVFPQLPPSYVYVIAGDGPEYPSIRQRLLSKAIRNRVFMMGRVSDEERNRLFAASDVFIMPNIWVDRDVEGFGIAAIEAGGFGLPVVASNIQGISDAVIEGKTGFLVKEKDVGEFIDRITNMKLNREDIRAFVISKFDWREIHRLYEHAVFNI
jgi:glycosyltransferase involved in cell wall biosynthesis